MERERGDSRSESTREGSNATHVRALAICALLAGCHSQNSMPTASSEANPREAAEIAMQSGDWGLAAERWYAVFLMDREAVEPCAMTARSLLHTRDAASASHVVDIGLERHPDDAELLELKGDALVELGYLRTAEDYYVRSLDRDGKRASALFSLAKLHMDLGCESAALDPLERAIELRGGDRATWCMLAAARSTTGNARG